MITVVDYGMGNLFSVANALDRLQQSWRFSGDADEVRHSDRILLPGVGSFREAMAHLERSGLAAALRDAAKSGAPLLGICLGMQLLAQWGVEDAPDGAPTPGLGLIAGTVVPLPAQASIKVPHIGFNEVRGQREHPLMTGIGEASDFYFVHSYHFDAAPDAVVARTAYGLSFASIVASGRVMGTQFHPEKSQATGLRLLRNFCAG